MTVKNMEEARALSEYYTKLQAAVDRALEDITNACMAGKYNVNVMHERQLQTLNGSAVADVLVGRGFQVNDSDEYDNKANNYRSIMVSW